MSPTAGFSKLCNIYLIQLNQNTNQLNVTVADRHYGIANGITKNNKGQIFIDDMFYKQIKVYDMNPSTYQLTHKYSFDSVFPIDNLKYDEEREVLVGGAIYNVLAAANVPKEWPKH